jgi:hypothetical protein
MFCEVGRPLVLPRGNTLATLRRDVSLLYDNVGSRERATSKHTVALKPGGVSMRVRVAFPLVAVLLVSALSSFAQASSPIYVYSPDPTRSWVYNYLNHDDLYQGNSIARDIGGTSTGWTTNDAITFNATSAANITAKVVAATTNCSNGGPDKYVMLEIYGDGLYYGRIDYVHLRSLSVSLNQVISPGTTIGYPQTTASSYWDGTQWVTCWTGLHVHVGTSYNGWASSGGTYYGTPMLTFPQGIGQSPIRPFDPSKVPHPQTD